MNRKVKGFDVHFQHGDPYIQALLSMLYATSCVERRINERVTVHYVGHRQIFSH